MLGFSLKKLNGLSQNPVVLQIYVHRFIFILIKYNQIFSVTYSTGMIG